jgi:hypothetical protein
LCGGEEVSQVQSRGRESKILRNEAKRLLLWSRRRDEEQALRKLFNQHAAKLVFECSACYDRSLYYSDAKEDHAENKPAI